MPSTALANCHMIAGRSGLPKLRQLVAPSGRAPAQATFLAAAGCKHAQGYHFSRPVDAERATELLRHGHIVPRRKLLRVIETTAA